MNDISQSQPIIFLPHGLQSDGRLYAFANIVREILRTYGTSHPIGTTGPVAQEPVLFRSTASLGFPPSDITSFVATQPANGQTWPIEIEVAFLGLYGPSSPLPAFWSERIVQGEDGAENLRDFLDLFGHPLIGLAYRIWQHYRVELHLDVNGPDTTAHNVLALAGLAADSSLAEDGLEWQRLLPLCGLLAQHSRSAEVVRRIVAVYFGVPVQVEEWLRCKVAIPPPQLFKIGSPAVRLGTGTVLGDIVPDAGGSMTMVLGPLKLEDFESFLPDGDRRKSLEALIRLALRDPLECGIDLVLAGDSGGFRLGTGRTGWTTWLAGGASTMRCPTGVA
jgi:type VI secretion system protein ImpH